jgi:hypothetical protein
MPWVPKTTCPFSGELCRAFLEIFFAEGAEIQLRMLILRQKYFLRQKYILFFNRREKRVL